MDGGKNHSYRNEKAAAGRGRRNSSPGAAGIVNRWVTRTQCTRHGVNAYVCM
jgi:hypothetical protein